MFYKMKPRPQRLIYAVPEYLDWENEAIAELDTYIAEN